MNIELDIIRPEYISELHHYFLSDLGKTVLVIYHQFNNVFAAHFFIVLSGFDYICENIM